MKKHLRRLLVILIVVAAIGAIVYYRTRPDPIAVTVAVAERGRVESTVANTRAGTVEAERRAKVAPTTSGQVVSLPVRQGDRVAAGDLLLELRNDDIRAELKAAESRARAAAARVGQICEMAASARREAARQQKLFELGLVPEEPAERTASEARAQTSACQAARADAELAKDQVKVIEAALARTRLAAPFAGVVAEVNAELGEIVSPSPPGIPTPPAVDLIDPGSLYVSAPIDEVDAPKVGLGMDARISLDALPGQSFAGKVRRMAPYVQDFEKQARTVDVEVDFASQPPANLLPGYSADAEIILEAHDGVLRIPTEAVVDSNYVFVIGADGTLVEREVETGLSNWQWTEIRSGLQDGERIVTSPNRSGVRAGVPASVEAGR